MTVRVTGGGGVYEVRAGSASFLLHGTVYRDNGHWVLIADTEITRGFSTRALALDYFTKLYERRRADWLASA